MSDNRIPTLGHRRVHRFTRDSERRVAHVGLAGQYPQTANEDALFDDAMDFLEMNAWRTLSTSRLLAFLVIPKSTNISLLRCAACSTYLANAIIHASASSDSRTSGRPTQAENLPLKYGLSFISAVAKIMIMPIPIHNRYSILPILGAVTWFVTLLVLLVTWVSTGKPHYASQEGDIAYISDVGADFLKPLFVTGSVITAISFVLTLASERLLGHNQRLLPAQRRFEKILSYCAVGGAALGGIGLILLSIFDTLRYSTLHRIFLFIFMLGVVLSALFTVVEFRSLSHSYESYHILRISYWAKGIISAVLVILAIVFVVMLAVGGRSSLNVGAILEWIIGFGFNLYLLTFWYDLRLAAPSNDIHKELKEGGLVAAKKINNASV